jgi:hypothetical protein
MSSATEILKRLKNNSISGDVDLSNGVLDEDEWELLNNITIHGSLDLTRANIKKLNNLVVKADLVLDKSGIEELNGVTAAKIYINDCKNSVEIKNSSKANLLEGLNSNINIDESSRIYEKSIKSREVEIDGISYEGSFSSEGKEYKHSFTGDLDLSGKEEMPDSLYVAGSVNLDGSSIERIKDLAIVGDLYLGEKSPSDIDGLKVNDLHCSGCKSLTIKNSEIKELIGGDEVEIKAINSIIINGFNDTNKSVKSEKKSEIAKEYSDELFQKIEEASMAGKNIRIAIGYVDSDNFIAGAILKKAIEDNLSDTKVDMIHDEHYLNIKSRGFDEHDEDKIESKNEFVIAIDSSFNGDISIGNDGNRTIDSSLVNSNAKAVYNYILNLKKDKQDMSIASEELLLLSSKISDISNYGKSNGALGFMKKPNANKILPDMLDNTLMHVVGRDDLNMIDKFLREDEEAFLDNIYGVDFFAKNFIKSYILENDKRLLEESISAKPIFLDGGDFSSYAMGKRVSNIVSDIYNTPVVLEWKKGSERYIDISGDNSDRERFENIVQGKSLVDNFGYKVNNYAKKEINSSLSAGLKKEIKREDRVLESIGELREAIKADNMLFGEVVVYVDKVVKDDEGIRLISNDGAWIDVENEKVDVLGESPFAVNLAYKKIANNPMYYARDIKEVKREKEGLGIAMSV